MRGKKIGISYRAPETENAGLRRAIRALENRIDQLLAQQTDVLVQKNEYIQTLEEANARLSSRVKILEKETK